MKFKMLDFNKDYVIDSPYITIKISYKEALEYLFPLIDRLEFQRNTLKKEYYERLKSDIIDGCIMPPITIAFDEENLFTKVDEENVEVLIAENIKKGFILDGIQRLNTINEASEDPNFNENHFLYASIIISDSMNKLLYRMIILNNGQKPMSARHQIEILVGKTIDKLNLDEEYKQMIFTEKDARKNDGVRKIKKNILTKAYLAYSSSSIHIDNQKIIEDKLNEIISRKIVNSNLKSSKVDLENLTKYIIKLAHQDESLIRWFNNENNMIGLFAGISMNNKFVQDIDIQQFRKLVDIVDESMNLFNISKIKVSKKRREIVMEVVSQYEDYVVKEIKTIDEYIYSEGS